MSGLEDPLRYRKHGFEYVEEEKSLLDELVMFHQKRLAVAQDYLNALEDLYTTTFASHDRTTLFFTSLAQPVLDSLRKDIKSQREYFHKTESDLARITFSNGPSRVMETIRKDLNAVGPLYSEFTSTRSRALQVSQPQLESLPPWRLPDEDIKLRALTAKLHLRQKAAREHFETSYPKLLDDHMEYMEQVKQLMVDNATHRSNLSAELTRHAIEEGALVEEFSSASGIAASHERMELEKDLLDYRHASVLNSKTRVLEDGVVSIILGGEIDSTTSVAEVVRALIVGCMERLLYAEHTESRRPINSVAAAYFTTSLPWQEVWEIIYGMELCADPLAVYNYVFELPNEQLEALIRIILENLPFPILNIEPAVVARFQDNVTRSSLPEIMEKVQQHNMRKLLRVLSMSFLKSDTDSFWQLFWRQTIGQHICTNEGIASAILRRWDFDTWAQLPDEVEWELTTGRDANLSLRRMKRFPARFKHTAKFIYLEVDEKGEIMDTPENEGKKSLISKSQQISEAVKGIRGLMREKK